MMVDVSLRIKGIDVDSPTAFERISEDFPDFLIQGNGKVVSLTFSANKTDAVADAVQKARKFLHAFPGSSFQSVDRDLVGVSDIAHRVGVSREGARKWVNEETFPAPANHIKSSAMDVWVWAEVAEWLLAERCIDMEEDLLTVAQMSQIENCLHGNPSATDHQWGAIAVSTRPSSSTGRGSSVTRKITPIFTGRRALQDYELVSSL